MSLGVWLAILSGALYGTLGLFGAYLLKEGLGICDFLFWRFLLSVLLILPFLNKKQHWQDVFSKDGIKVILVCAFFYGTATSFFFFSNEYIGTGLAMVLFYCYPIFVVLFEWLYSKKAPSSRTLQGFMIVLLGVFLMSDTISSNFSLEGIGWGIFCAFCFGVYFYTSQQSIKNISLISGTFCSCLGNLLIFALIALYKGSLYVPTTAWAIGNITGLAILATILPIYFVFLALRTIDGSKASILSVFEPIVCVLLGVLLLDEQIAIIQYFGGVIILVGVYFVQGCKGGDADASRLLNNQLKTS